MRYVNTSDDHYVDGIPVPFKKVVTGSVEQRNGFL